jgi:hypothetical protein
MTAAPATEAPLLLLNLTDAESTAHVLATAVQLGLID